MEFSRQRGGSDENYRKRAFFSAIDLLKTVQKENLTNLFCQQGSISYEFKGITPEGRLVGAHIKEMNEKGNSVLKLISIFWKE